MGSTSRTLSSITEDQMDDQLESAMAEMGKVKKENEVLKMNLSKMMKEYHSLQLYLTNMVQQEEAKISSDAAPTNQEIEESEISLSLGMLSSEPEKEEKRSNSSNERDDEASQQIHLKKARVSVRTRCDSPTMNDGCQWRKYGQKMAKGNPCPRAYYRCTVSPTCPVRKRVQRCAEDMSLLISTYEGNHNHPLSVLGNAMASTTSAAASILMSGSSSSGPALGASATTTTSADLHGLNFNLSDNTRARQFYLPNSSVSSLPSYPTITLDLSAPPSSSFSSSQFNRFNTSFHSTPRYSTSLGNEYLSYGTQSYNKGHIGSLSLGKQPQEQFYQPYMQKNNLIPQQAMSEIFAATTNAFTSDPSLRSVLEAAITSIVNKGSAGI